MDNLSIQLHHHLAKYLGPRDLQNMRLMNKKWDGVAKDKLQGQGFNFIFQDDEMLIEFNTIFVNYDPPQYLSTSKFTFMLPVLASTEALPHLNTFAQTFGTSVTRLVLNFDKPDYNYGPWATAQEKATVDRHVTLLLSSVKNQIMELQFQGYTGLDPAVLGTDPFPVLTNVKIQNNNKYTDGDRNRRNHEYVAANEEACILDLSQKIPAIQNFAFQRYVFCDYHDSPTYLPAVLQTVIQANPNVLCQLEFIALIFIVTEEQATSAAAIRAAQFVDAVAGVPVKISELSSASETELGLRASLSLISQNADTLTKLSFLDHAAVGHGLKFPLLPVLEELNFCQWTYDSLLGFDSADRYPNLRKLSTYFSGNDFLVPHPRIVDLTLDFMPATGYVLFHVEGVEDAAELGRRILATFPNITTLTCNAAFLEFQSFYNFTGLRKLKITRNYFVEADGFWASATQNAPKIPFDEILALEAPAEREIVTDPNGNILPSFQDIQHLEEFILSIQAPEKPRAIESLDAIVYASKFKKLQRLHMVVIELGADVVKDKFQNIVLPGVIL